MSIKHILILSVFFLFVKSGMAQSTPVVKNPVFHSVQEREAWMKTHPGQNSTLDTTGISSTTPTTASVSQSTMPADFPKYVNTGNKEQDDANYTAAKAAWIAQHPDEYAKMIGKQPK